jgi:hypothetical protein
VLPTVGADLAGVQPNVDDRWWKLTLNGVMYSYEYSYWEDEFGGQYYEYSTRVHATSFAFEFFGPDAAILNDVVSSQLTLGGVADGAFLEFADVQYFDPDEWSAWGYWSLQLDPLVPATGVRFVTSGSVDWFDADEFGYPLVQPQRLRYGYSSIDDFRPGNGGSLQSYDDYIDIGSDQQPLLPVKMRIEDRSALEGDKGVTILSMTVTLSRPSSHTVTANYQTVDGTALVSNRDYVRTSGTLTFRPGETSKTIAVSINGDRKRESNETFTVQLSNAFGAIASKWVGTATILNDD